MGIIGRPFRLPKYRYTADTVLKNGYDGIDGFGSKEFTRGDVPKYYNCIPYGYALPSKTNPNKFEVKPEYTSGTIDAYDEFTDAVGIYFGQNLVWFAREFVWITDGISNGGV